MPRKPKERTAAAAGYVSRSVTIPNAIDAKLQDFAKREERPLSFVIAKALAEFFERNDKRK